MHRVHFNHHIERLFLNASACGRPSSSSSPQTPESHRQMVSIIRDDSAPSSASCWTETRSTRRRLRRPGRSSLNAFPRFYGAMIFFFFFFFRWFASLSLVWAGRRHRESCETDNSLELTSPLSLSLSLSRFLSFTFAKRCLKKGRNGLGFFLCGKRSDPFCLIITGSLTHSTGSSNVCKKGGRKTLFWTRFFYKKTRNFWWVLPFFACNCVPGE